MVVGPPGEEIFTDKYGRVKVQFYWDREGKNNTDSLLLDAGGALRGRGKKWGRIHIPRIGQEVMVEVSGRRSRPAGGRWAASITPTDAALRAARHKTVSTMKSRSTKHGGQGNYNELRFEDLKDKEQVFFHAERDKDERVKAESREYVGGHRHLFVKKSQLENVNGNKHSTVGGNYYFTTGGEHHIHVKKQIVEHDENDVIRTIDGDYDTEIKGNVNRQVDKDAVSFIKNNYMMDIETGDMKVVCNHGNWIVSAGMNTAAISAKNVSINATASLSLQVGGSCISISPSSISISSPMVYINTGPAVAVPAPPGPNIQANLPFAPDDAAGPNIADDGTKFDKM